MKKIINGNSYVDFKIFTMNLRDLFGTIPKIDSKAR